MTKNILFSNKMLVLLQTYTKKGETHTYPLAFPPFWAYSMSCFETILFRHAGFPGAANVLLGALSVPFGGSQTQTALCGNEKPGPIFFPCLHAAGHFVHPFRGQPNAGHSLRAFTRKRPFTPAAAAPAGRAGALAAKWRCDPPPRRPAL